MVNVNSKGNALTPGLQVNICGCEHKQRHRCDERQPAENNKERLRNPVVCDGGGKNHRNPSNHRYQLTGKIFLRLPKLTKKPHCGSPHDEREYEFVNKVVGISGINK